MRFKTELTKDEQKQKQQRRERLLAKFPGAVAEIEAIWDKKEPFVDKPTMRDYQKPRASSTPPIPIHIQTGATHPVSGMPETQVRTAAISIWPVSGRTDQAGILTKYYNERLPSGGKGPIGLLEILADPDFGWGKVYNLRPVPQEVLEAERRGALQPESRRELERLEKSGQLTSNDTSNFKLKPSERLVRSDGGNNLDAMLEESDPDPLDQFSDEEMAELGQFEESNVEAVTMEQD